MDFDATQVLDLDLTTDEGEGAEKTKIGKLITQQHIEMSSKEFIIYQGTNIIGRDDRADLPMTVKSLSKRHACIEASVDGTVICDFGSCNKTRKGKMVLKPSIRYEINDGDQITFGNLICRFYLSTEPRVDDGDETGSITASETDSESMLPPAATTKSVSNNNHVPSKQPPPNDIDEEEEDEEDSPSIFQANHAESEEARDADVLKTDGGGDESFNSSDIVLPTQKYTKTKEDDRDSIDSLEEELKKVNKEEEKGAYVMDTDDETDDGETDDVIKDTSMIIGQTPGIGLKKPKLTMTLPESDLDATIGTPNDKSTQPPEKMIDSSENDDAKLELFMHSPSPSVDEPAADKLSCSFSDEVANDQQFADTLPLAATEGEDTGVTTVDDESETEHQGTIGKLLAEQFADTLPIAKDADDAEDKMNYDDIVGTYQFDTDGFDGNQGDGGDDSSDETESDDDDDDKRTGEKQQEKEKEETIHNKGTSVQLPPPALPAKSSLPSTFNTPTFEDNSSQSQEVPYKSCKTSTRIMESFQSFGTPVSSINASGSSHGRQSFPKMVVTDSEGDDEAATQAYNITSPVKPPQPKLPPPAGTRGGGVSLPGASSVYVYEAVDTATQMSSDDDIRGGKKAFGKKSVLTTESSSVDNYEAVDIATQMSSDEDKRGGRFELDKKTAIVPSKEVSATEAPTDRCYATDNTQVYADMNTQAYGDAATQVYGDAATQAYGDAPTQAYGDTATQAYGDAATQAYGDAATQAYGDAATQVYGDAATQAYGDAATQAYGDAATQAYGDAATQAYADVDRQAYATMDTDGDAQATQAYFGQVGSDDETASEAEEDEGDVKKTDQEENVAKGTEITGTNNHMNDEVKDDVVGGVGDDELASGGEDETQAYGLIEAIEVESIIVENEDRACISPDGNHIDNTDAPDVEVEEEIAEKSTKRGRRGQKDKNSEASSSNLDEVPKRVRSKKSKDETNETNKTEIIDNEIDSKATTRKGKGRKSKKEKQDLPEDNIEEPEIIANVIDSKTAKRKGRPKKSVSIDNDTIEEPEIIDNEIDPKAMKGKGKRLKSKKEKDLPEDTIKEPEIIDNEIDSKAKKGKGKRRKSEKEKDLPEDTIKEPEIIDNVIDSKSKKGKGKRGTSEKEKDLTEDTIEKPEIIDNGIDSKRAKRKGRPKKSVSVDNDTIEEPEIIDNKNYPKATKGKSKRRKSENEKDLPEDTVEKPEIDSKTTKRKGRPKKSVSTVLNNVDEKASTSSVKDTEDNALSFSEKLYIPHEECEKVKGHRKSRNDSLNETEANVNDNTEHKPEVEVQKPKRRGRPKRKVEKDIHESANYLNSSKKQKPDGDPEDNDQSASVKGHSNTASSSTDVLQQQIDEKHLNDDAEVAGKKSSKGKGRSKRKAKHDMFNEDEPQPQVEENHSPIQPSTKRKGRKTTAKHDSVTTEAQSSMSSPSKHTEQQTPVKGSKSRQPEADLDESSSSTASHHRRSSIGGKPRVVFTGISDKTVEKIVTNLGGTTIEHLDKATHLVTDKVRRTVKFMCAVAKGVPIVTPEWLKRSKNAGVFTDYQEYLLKDTAAEKQYDFKLKDSLVTARNHPLLQDIHIHVTKSVKPEPKCMREMIECCGGKYVTKSTKLADDVLIISCEEDSKEWSKFKGHHICSNELLLTGILRQEIDTKQFALENAEDNNAATKGKRRKTKM